MTDLLKTKAVAPYQENTASEEIKLQGKSSTDAAIIASKSTATEAQELKTLALLRQGPKTTIQLRSYGILMPAARIHKLRHVDGHQIESELIHLYDEYGFRHSKCAKYHLVAEAKAEARHG